jgi:Asp-tRNA(Asn)/Glu-tRNA(Gln) amidotransferase A subunit family amidase
VGPLARSVSDLELMLRVTAGPDARDVSSVPFHLGPKNHLDVANLRIGCYEDDGVHPVTSETRAAVRRAAGLLREQGFSVESFSLAGFEQARRLWWTLFGICGAAALRPLLRGREQEIHPLVLDLLAPPDESMEASFDDLLGAWVERDRLRTRLAEMMESHPILLGPAGSVPAFRHGERQWTIDDRTVGYAEAFTYCQIFNLLGNPAVVLPVGRSPEGLPVGVQLVGRPFEDLRLLTVARKLEEALGPWRPPPVEM